MTMPSSPDNLPAARTVAKYLLHLAGRDEIEDMDQFKVQKTLYFCQCWSLALRDRPLFSDEVQAWRYGPVVPAVYRDFSHRGDEFIEPGAAPPLQDLDQDDRDFVDSVWHDIRQYTGRAMKEWTHAPGPWTVTWGNRPEWDRSENVIPQDQMRNFFRDRAASWRRS